MRTQHIAGNVRAEHIASLGSVDADVSVRERLAFWAKLPERLARLGNRVGPDDHAKIYAALHARTPDEQRAIQEENAKNDERFWDTTRDLNASHIEGHKALIALAEKKIAEMEPEVEKAAERVEVARSRLEKLKRGEDVAGGLGKFDVDAMFKLAGIDAALMRRIRLRARQKLTKAEFEAALANTKSAEAADEAFDREGRRIIRARE